MLTDIRYGLRVLVRDRAFAIVALLTLALGIGVSTAIFSVIYGAVIRPLPYPDADQLVSMSVSRSAPSLDDARSWRNATGVLSGIGSAHGPSQIIVDGVEPERVAALDVSEGYLELFGVSAVVGRLIDRGDVRIGAEPVVMVGWRYWQGRLGGKLDVVGTMLLLESGSAAIIGVLPQSFDPDIAVVRPLQPNELNRSSRRSAALRTYARLKKGVSISQAQSNLDELLSVTGDSRGSGTRLESLYQVVTSDYRSTVNALSCAVALILVIACVNISGFLLARCPLRERELAIRMSLGASRGRIIRQLVTESVVLGLAGGAGGIALAWLSLDGLVAILPVSLAWNSAPPLSLPVLGFAVSLAFAASLMFGTLPALRLSRMDPGPHLGLRSGRVGATWSRWGAQLLMIAEAALAVILLAGAGLLLRSVARASLVDVGFNPEQVLMVSSTPLGPAFRSVTYYSALIGSLKRIPGVEAVGAIDLPPLGGADSSTVAQVPGEKPVSVYIRHVLPDYFAATGIPVRAGVSFQEADTRLNQPPVVINQQAASLLFGAVDSVGRTVTVGKVAQTVIGVVGDVRHGGPLWPPEPEVYSLADKDTSQPLTTVLRVGSGTRISVDQIRSAAKGVGPSILFEGVRSGSDLFDDRILKQRHRALLFGLLGGLGVFLATIGIGSMTAYAVSRRTREIGIRMAFGAQARDILLSVTIDAVLASLLGTVAGLGLARLGTKLIAAFLFETSPNDLAVFTLAGIVFAVTAWGAAWLAGRRAARVDPTIAMRAD